MNNIENIAYRIAVRHFFCNVDENFPEDIEDLSECLSFGCGDFEVWEPFEGYSNDWIINEVINLMQDIERHFAQQKHVEFVSYTGKWPNLCQGVLTLLIDGEEVVFGDNYETMFWSSGGDCGIGSKGEWTSEDEWIINNKKIPEKYQKYAKEICEVFNKNIPFGCCGGCL